MQNRWILVVLLSGLSSPLFAQEVRDDGSVFFEQRIRPVLVQHCYSCHSVEARDAKKLQGSLFLDSAEGILIGGEDGPALVKGRSVDSKLLKAMKFEGLEMPPSGKLSDEIIADVAKWIDMGAPDPRHGDAQIKPKRDINIEEGRHWWAFQPLRVVALPQVPHTAADLTAIDRFVLSAQSQHGLTPSSQASKEKLIRRAYFDLIGLPPTPEQVDAFVNDSSTHAFEAVIDGLLESPHYGEKWARHWLDVARFAESGGYEFDGFRPGAYHYRDWVIRSLNDDLPYDQFVRMQLAGDKLLPDDYLASSASGFLVAGPYPGQTTAKTIEGIRYDQLDDMLMTVGGSMLGLTLGCVRCHDHKYDPLQQKDYYGLAATLAQTSHGTRAIDPNPAATQQSLDEYRKSREPLAQALAQFAIHELPKRFETWQNAELAKQPDAPRWQVMEPVAVEADRTWLKWLPGGIVAHDGKQISGAVQIRDGQRRVVPNNDTYTIRFHTYQKNVTSLRLDALADKSLPQRGPGLNDDGSFHLAEFTVNAKPLDSNSAEPPQALKLKPALAAFADSDGPLTNAVDGNPETAWGVRATAKVDNAAVFELETSLPGFESGTELTVTMKFQNLGIGRMRFSMSTEPNPATWAGDSIPQHLGEIRAILAAHGNRLPDSHRESMVRWFSPFDADTAKAQQPVRDHLLAEPRPSLVEVYTTVAGGQDVFHLRRGEVDNKQGKAEPSFIQVLLPSASSTSSGQIDPAQASADPRVALAEWITSLDRGAGPLLARVIVNRLWQHHYGEGIVGSPNNFGSQGDLPTHPELLEWLASQLVSHGWSLKALHKQMMLTAVYQQSHEVLESNLKVDPTNRYLWHYQTRRLDAELIRDSLLAAGDNLDRTLFGPSILDDTPRRSVYLRVKRSELIPSMTTFDAPEPTQSVGERISTTVPTQSLSMMNSPFVRLQAEKLSQRIRPAADVPLANAIEHAYRIVFSRRPSDSERAKMAAFIESQQSLIEGDSATKTDKAVVEFCQVLLCINEFIYID